MAYSPNDFEKYKNKVFNNWTVIEQYKSNKYGNNTTFWKCRCKCGYINNQLTPYSILNSLSKMCQSCAAINDWNIEDLTNKKIGKLTVLHRIKKGKKSLWKCRCDCGNEIDVTSGSLRQERVSCGCRATGLGIENKSWKGYGEISQTYFAKIIESATRHKKEFNLTIEYLWNLFLKQNRKCSLSGMDIYFPKYVKNSDKDRTASLDRIDSSKGYIIGNVQWVHKWVNIMKMDFDQEWFIETCHKISKFNKSNNAFN